MNIQTTRAYVSDHALLRYLERACEVDLSYARCRTDDEGEVMRYAQRVLEIPVENVRKRILELIFPALMLGASSMKVDAGMFILDNGSAVTFIDRKTVKVRYVRSTANVARDRGMSVPAPHVIAAMDTRSARSRHAAGRRAIAGR